ncbi:MAG: DMT family transporter [Woeseiaceae bacterium]
MSNYYMSPIILTLFAMLAFAANSVLCRLALVNHAGEASIDAASFTSIRLLSGAIILILILLVRTREFKPKNINPISASMLFIYAICFSFSYIEISTGTGALILFGTVQLTMIMFGLIKGERSGYLALMGILLAFTGLVYLLLPSVSAPPIMSALLMMVAGLAWGIYSLRGKAISNPLIATSWNFIGTLPLVLLTYLIFQDDVYLTQKGIVLAILSGALASGVGYSIWYAALPHLTTTRAATVQLTVPIIAATGGIMLLSEPVSLRLVIASTAVLGGVYLTIKSAKYEKHYRKIEP